MLTEGPPLPSPSVSSRPALWPFSVDRAVSSRVRDGRPGATRETGRIPGNRGGSKLVVAGLATAALRGSRLRGVLRPSSRWTRCSAVLPRLEGLSSLDDHVTRHDDHRNGDHEHHEPPELGAVVRQLYASFNQCDAHRTAACFTEDVVYEDLLLGNSTIVQSREEFFELIRTHPVFVSARACGMLGLPPLDIKVEVDNISEDMKRYTVGVEWHVEVGGQPLVLGRGLSFMKIDPKTGLIAKATDIAEAPWRAIGVILSPFARGIRDFSRLLRDWSFSSVITVVLFAVLFMDQSSLDQLRDDIDTLDDFRKGLDQSDHTGLKALLAEVVDRKSVV